MAVVEIQDTWFTHPRRFKLAGLLGSLELADGVAVAVWHLGHQYAKAKMKKRHGGLIPLDVFNDYKYQDAAVQSGLVEVRDEGVYVKGYSIAYGYLARMSEGGRRGGERGLDRPRNPDGSYKSGPKSAPSLTKPHPSLTKPHQTPIPIPIPKKKKTYAQGELERVYNSYPRKVGKTKGLQKLQREIKTLEDLANLERAVTNYAASVKKSDTKQEYVKHFSTFASEWRDWIDLDQGVQVNADLNKSW